MKIQDGKGSGKWAEVDAENRLKTFSVVETHDKHVNREGHQWSIPFTVTPTGAGDYFFYLKNTGSETYAISDIRIMCAAAETITYNWVSGTPTYDTSADIVAVNRNGSAVLAPSATIKKDVNITNLSDEGEIFFERCASANTRYKLSTSSNILIPTGKAIAFIATTGTASIKCIVSLTGLDS